MIGDNVVNIVGSNSHYQIWPTNNGSGEIVFDVRNTQSHTSICNNLSEKNAVALVTAVFNALPVEVRVCVARELDQVRIVEEAANHLRKYGVDDTAKVHATLTSKYTTKSWEQIDDIVKSATKIVIAETIRKKREQILALEFKLNNL